MIIAFEDNRRCLDASGVIQKFWATRGGDASHMHTRTFDSELGLGIDRLLHQYNEAFGSRGATIKLSAAEIAEIEIRMDQTRAILDAIIDGDVTAEDIANIDVDTE